MIPSAAAGHTRTLTSTRAPSLVSVFISMSIVNRPNSPVRIREKSAAAIPAPPPQHRQPLPIQLLHHLRRQHRLALLHIGDRTPQLAKDGSS